MTVITGEGVQEMQTSHGEGARLPPISPAGYLSNKALNPSIHEPQ